jgi:ABC-type lipopolysaccharide export system ATPase subunit
MANVQKTITLEVIVTVEVDEDLIGTEGVDDVHQLAENVAYGIQYMDQEGELFRGGKVKEYIANVLDVEDTEFQYSA